MFRGSFVHAVDAKGRVSVPARFRDLIVAANETGRTEGDRVVITNFRNGPTPCLDVYPLSAWLRLEDTIGQQPQFDPKVQAFTHYYISQAQECQVDKQGRILLPPLLREYARLRDTAMFTGAGPRFQIWDQRAWQEVHERSEALIFDDANAFFTGFKF